MKQTNKQAKQRKQTRKERARHTHRAGRPCQSCARAQMGRGHEPRGRKGDRYLTLVRNLAIQGGIVVLRHDVVVVGTGRHVDGGAQGVERDFVGFYAVNILVPHSYVIDSERES